MRLSIILRRSAWRTLFLGKKGGHKVETQDGPNVSEFVNFALA